MANSTPIYDQFARNKISLRNSQQARHSPALSPSKNSISFITTAPIESSPAHGEQMANRSRPQSQFFSRERPQSQFLPSANQEQQNGSPRTTDLKHSRSQSHALFSIKRKEVSHDGDVTPKRAQSVLETRGFGQKTESSAHSTPLGARPLPEISTGPSGHRNDVRGGTGHAAAPVSVAEAVPAFSKKFVVVGDGGSGKTCLLMRYKERTFPDTYVPTVFENYITHKHHRGTGKTCEVALWDTAGQEEYDRLRPLSYPETDVLLVCFAIDCPQSLDSVKEKWYPEVLHFCPPTPLILVGCKSDLRDNDRVQNQLEGQGLHMLTIQQCLNIANYIGAEAYMECSSKEMINVDEVFELSMDIAVANETGTDWRTNSIVGRMLSRGQLGGASQLGRKLDGGSSSTQNGSGGGGHATETSSAGAGAGVGVGFVGSKAKGMKKRRRGAACKIL